MNDTIFDIEAMLRSVIGQILESSFGSDWVATLSNASQRELRENLQRVMRVRSDAPQDAWDAAGLVQIRDTVARLLEARSSALRMDALGLLWSNAQECRVDLGRLIAFRPAEAHPGVASPLGSADRALAAALVRRTRLAAEAARRCLLDDAGEWWPFIEQVTSPGVGEWRFVRGSTYPTKAQLVEGDHLELQVAGVNPRGSDADLEFALMAGQQGGSLLYAVGWQASPILEAIASRAGRNVVFVVAIRDRAGAQSGVEWDDEVSFVAKVVPQSPSSR